MVLRWFVVRVLSGREESIVRSLNRRIQAAGLTEKAPRIIVPHELVSEIRGGQRKVKKRKILPGYVMIQVETTEKEITESLLGSSGDQEGHGIDEEVWFALRDTPGFGDFLGGGKAEPLPQEEADRMLKLMEDPSRKPIPKIKFNRGDQVKIKEGPFENFEGSVEEINPDKGIVKVVVNIFGRSTPVELEYWQVEML